jgi:hypothetical protein
MVTRIASIGLAVITAAVTAASAGTLTEQLQSERLTVVKVDHVGGRMQCAEHRRWVSVVKADLADVRPGDIVRVEPTAGKRSRIVLVRAAVEELGSPE